MSDERVALPDRRKPDEQIIALTAILSSVDSLHREVKKIDEMRHDVADIKRDLTQHVENEEGNWKLAFPDGDADGHRRAHEAQIKKAEEEAVFWSKMRIKAGEMTVYGFLVVCGILIAFYWNGHVPSSMSATIPKLGG